MTDSAYRICPHCDVRFDDRTLQRCPNDGQRLLLISSNSDALVGTVIADRFTIIDVIAHGGFGTVYRAVQHPVERDVAIKVLKREFATDEQHVRRFYNEAKSVSKLRNQHTIELYDFGQTQDGALFMAIELSPGQTLTSLVQSKGRLDPGVAAFVGGQICEALSEAHAQGIIHRDLKPENIMIEARSHDPHFVKVLDFGIAKWVDASSSGPVTATGIINGTPAYMAPEQIQVEELTPACDLYALGVILYWSISGKLPIEGETPIATVLAQVQQTPQDIRELVPSISDELATLIMSLLAKDPALRPESANIVRGLLMAEASVPDTSRAVRASDSSVGTSELRKPSSNKADRTWHRNPQLEATVQAPTPASTVMLAMQSHTTEARLLEEASKHQGSSRRIWAIAVVLLGVMAAVWVGIQHRAEAPVEPDETSGTLSAQSSTESNTASSSRSVVEKVQLASPKAASPQVVEMKKEPAPVQSRLPSSSYSRARRGVEASPVAATLIQLFVTSSGGKATVTLDNVVVGVTPTLIEKPLSQAQRILRVSRRGFVTKKQSVVFDVNRQIAVTLRKKKRHTPKKRTRRSNELMGPND